MQDIFEKWNPHPQQKLLQRDLHHGSLGMSLVCVRFVFPGGKCRFQRRECTLPDFWLMLGLLLLGQLETIILSATDHSSPDKALCSAQGPRLQSTGPPTQTVEKCQEIEIICLLWENIPSVMPSSWQSAHTVYKLWAFVLHRLHTM